MTHTEYVGQSPVNISVTASVQAEALHFNTRSNSHSNVFWNGTQFLELDVECSSETVVPIGLLFGRDGTDVAAVSAHYSMFPGIRARLVFPISALDGQSVFLPRTPGRLKSVVFGDRIDPAEVAWFEIRVAPLPVSATVLLHSAQILNTPSGAEPSGPVLVDALGQWTCREWPGKMESVPQLTSVLRSRLADVRERETDASLTAYGGTVTKDISPTGYFRTAKVKDRWWLVDPDGGLFWSAGVDCVGAHSGALVTGNEKLCAWIPDPLGPFADAWHGDSNFSWSTANLIRAYGTEWYESWCKLTRSELRAMGFNTVGNWSDLAFAKVAQFPYVLPLENFPTTEHCVFRDFPDVFSHEYTSNANVFAQQLTRFVTDKHLIGYFLRNEPLWAFGDFCLAGKMLERAPSVAPASRQKLGQFLHEQMKNDPDRYRTAWSTVLSGPEDICSFVCASADELPELAQKDLESFTVLMVDAYVRIPSDACRQVDPHHLNLGMRWAWVSSDYVFAGADSCDVFSMNCYKMRPDLEAFEMASARSGLPVMIGEFHFGAADRGLACNALKGVATQEDRGRAYRYFVEQAAAHPVVIGAHWFQWNDQPFLGRFDGESFQIGLVDVCNTPYAEIKEACRTTNNVLYDIATGTRAPLNEPPIEVEAVGI